MLFYKLGITEINYYLALIIVLMTSKVGALFPDLDHDWHSIGNKTVPNKIINVLIHATGGKHRSWQTHSIDICAWFTVAAFTLPSYLTKEGIISQVNREVLSILWLGFASGWISHLFSDMLTSAGVRLFCFVNKKIKLVPRKIGKLVFNTGHEWEAFNYKVIKIINIFLGIICLAYPLVIESGILN
jgi:membrane-bound metal-dependent hydrolase YbcI (DUF457 family)